jgi:hypothetical protein
MSRSIDAIWRSTVSRQLGSDVADRELHECASSLGEFISKLSRTAKDGCWQEHYEIALQVCRIARRVRFRFIEPRSFDWETKSEIVRLLSAAQAAIRSDTEATGVAFRVKTLDEIKANINYRVERITDESDEPLFDAGSSATER